MLKIRIGTCVAEMADNSIFLIGHFCKMSGHH